MTRSLLAGACALAWMLMPVAGAHAQTDTVLVPADDASDQGVAGNAALADDDSQGPVPFEGGQLTITQPEQDGEKVLAYDGKQLASNYDVFFDKVVGIESLGEQEVFDATVPGPANFVANAISVHNSLEQDADMVLFIARDEVYDQESPRKGEADFIVAKHRNGPTDTVTVAAQLHFSRFVDMAI